MGKWTYIRVSDVAVQSVAYFDRKVSVLEDAFIALWKANIKILVYLCRCLLSKGFSRLGKWFFPVKQAQDAAAKGRRFVLFFSAISIQKLTFDTSQTFLLL